MRDYATRLSYIKEENPKNLLIPNFRFLIRTSIKKFPFIFRKVDPFDDIRALPIELTTTIVIVLESNQ